MHWNIIIGYFTIAIISCIVFEVFAGKDAEKATICLASTLWPIAWLIVLVILVEKLVKFIIKLFVHIS